MDSGGCSSRNVGEPSSIRSWGVIQRFDSLHTSNLQWLKSANVVLLPKKDGAEGISDYRPISLIPAITNIIAKNLSLRLAPHMDDLVSNTQSAFIKRRSIHDNFMYFRIFALRLHTCKTHALLFKFDIKKEFDSVKWGYILELLQRLGFPPNFWDWIAALLSSSSSWIMLNGLPYLPVKHGRGFRQGDPISPSSSCWQYTPCIRSSTWRRGKGSSTRSVVGDPWCVPPFMRMTRRSLLLPSSGTWTISPLS